MADITTTVQDGETLELAYNAVNTSPHVGRQQQVELLAPDGTVIDSDAILLEAEDSERGVLRTGALTDGQDDGIYEVISEEGSRTVQVYVNVPETSITLSSYGSFFDTEQDSGLVIKSSLTWYDNIDVQLASDMSGFTNLYIIRDDDGTVERNKDVSSFTGGDVINVSLNQPLEKGVLYRVLVDAAGGTYTASFQSLTLPISSSDGVLTIPYGWQSGSYRDNAVQSVKAIGDLQ